MIRSIVREYRAAFERFSPNARRFLLVSLSFQLGMQAFSFILTLYLKKSGYDEAVIGSVLSAQRIGAAVVALPASFLLSRHGSPRLIAASFAMCALAATSLALANGIASLAAASFSLGCASTVVVVFSAPFLLRNSTEEERVHLFSVNGAIVWVASTLGNAAGYLKDALAAGIGLDEILSYRIAMFAGIGCMVFALILVLGLKRREYGFRDAPRLGTESVASDSKPSNTSLDGWRRIVPLFLKLLLPGFLIGIGAGLTIPYLNLYFKSQFSLSDSVIATIMAGGQVFTLAGIAIGPALARRKGKAWVILASQGLSIPFIIALTYASFLPFVVMAYMARQALMNMNGPLADNFILEKVPVERQHLLNALRTFVWTGSWAIAVLASGIVIKGYGYAASFTITAVLYAAATVLFGVFWKTELRQGL